MLCRLRHSGVEPVRIFLPLADRRNIPLHSQGHRADLGLPFVPTQAILVLPMSSVRVILWPSAMAYTGFLLTGQGPRTFNSLSITEACLGGLTGFLLSIMFTLREKRHQKPAFIAHSIVQFVPHLRAFLPKRNRNDR